MERRILAYDFCPEMKYAIIYATETSRDGFIRSCQVNIDPISVPVFNRIKELENIYVTRDVPVLNAQETDELYSLKEFYLKFVTKEKLDAWQELEEIVLGLEREDMTTECDMQSSFW